MYSWCMEHLLCLTHHVKLWPCQRNFGCNIVFNSWCQRYFQYHTRKYYMNISGLVFFIMAGRASIRISNAYRDMINIWFLWLELICHANLLHCSGHCKFFDRHVVSFFFSISASLRFIKIHQHDLNWTPCRPVISSWWAQKNQFWPDCGNSRSL